MKKVAGIYKITSPSGKVYIGQSWEINERFGGYRRRECKGQRALMFSFQKHGVDAHTFDVIHPVDEAICTQPEMDRLEQHYMDEHRSRGILLLNCREAGSNGKLSEETRRRVSESLKGRTPWNKGVRGIIKLSEDTRRKISEANRGKASPLRGIKRDPSIGAKISAANTGRKRPAEEAARMRDALNRRTPEQWAAIGRRISESKRGKSPNLSDAERLRRSKAARGNSNMRGKHHSAATRKIIGEKGRGRPPNSGSFQPGKPSPKSAAWRAAMSARMTGRKLSEETKQKIREKRALQDMSYRRKPQPAEVACLAT